MTPQYAAGFFDGEGCVYIANKKSRQTGSLVVCITNTHRGILDELQRVYGGGINARSNMKPRHRQQYQWVLSTRKAIPFLRHIAPFVIVKRDVVALSLQFAEVMERPHSAKFTTEVFAGATRLRVRPKRTPEYIADTDRIKRGINSLNARGFNAMRKAALA